MLPELRGYTVKRVLGHGGMGVALLAFHGTPPQPVVIKMMSPALLGDAKMVARFRREARQLRAIRHPNVVRFIEFVEQTDQSFLVMEYAQGEQLSSILKRHGPLPLPMFAPIAVQILRGVAHAHDHGVVLRDVKAANVMLCPSAPRAQIVKLLDFGLAKAVAADSIITRNEVLGTMGYLAPEVSRGEHPDLRSDVYSLGVLFYVMVTGRLPSDPLTPRRGQRSRHESIPPIAALLLHSNLPREVSLIIDRCLAPERARRPTHAGQVLESLTRVVDPAQLRRDMEHPAWRSGPQVSASPRVDLGHRSARAPTEPSLDDCVDHEAPTNPGIPDPVTDDTTELFTRILRRR